MTERLASRRINPGNMWKSRKSWQSVVACKAPCENQFHVGWTIPTASKPQILPFGAPDLAIDAVELVDCVIVQQRPKSEAA